MEPRELSEGPDINAKSTHIFPKLVMQRDNKVLWKVELRVKAKQEQRVTREEVEYKEIKGKIRNWLIKCTSSYLQFGILLNV